MRRKALLLLAVVVGVVFVALVVFYLTRAPRIMARRAIGKTEQRLSIASLVTQVRDLSRLETASMKVMHVSTITQSYGVVPNELLGDKLTFLAVGDVIAGIDLSHLTDQDVRYTGNGELVMDLPPPMILVVRVDNQESRVLNRDTGMLRRADVHLESRIRAQAEASIRNEALRKGVLTLAEQNAEKKLADFLHRLGFQRVIFEHREATTQRR